VKKTKFCTEDDVYDIASLLKLYLRELPIPVLTYELYDCFIATYSLPQQTRLQSVASLIMMLPTPHLHLLMRICDMVNIVLDNAAFNKMRLESLSICFAPNILKSRDDSIAVALGDAGIANAVVLEIFSNCKKIFARDSTLHHKIPKVVISSEDVNESRNEFSTSNRNSTQEEKEFSESDEKKIEETQQQNQIEEPLIDDQFVFAMRKNYNRHKRLTLTHFQEEWAKMNDKDSLFQQYAMIKSAVSEDELKGRPQSFNYEDYQTIYSQTLEKAKKELENVFTSSVSDSPIEANPIELDTITNSINVDVQNSVETESKTEEEQLN